MSSISQPSCTIRTMTDEEFRPLIDEHWPPIFSGKPRLALNAILSEEENMRIKQLRETMGSPLMLRYGVFDGDAFVGWHFGEQKSASEYYMRNSAILPAYRRHGLYSSLLRFVVDDLVKRGFQTITSRHTAVNNAVIIPKLKLGFVITGFELSDVFGTLVNLTYFTNPGRRKVLAFRAGEEQADADVRHWLGL